MNAQKMFEKVCKHLFEQGKKSISSKGRCLYRGPKGTKCAAGFMIPDKEYKPIMDKYCFPLSVIVKKFPNAFPSSAKKNMKLLKQLQNVHDENVYDENDRECNWISTQTMRYALKNAGEKFKLDVSFLNDLSFKDK